MLLQSILQASFLFISFCLLFYVNVISRSLCDKIKVKQKRFSSDRW